MYFWPVLKVHSGLKKPLTAFLDSVPRRKALFLGMAAVLLISAGVAIGTDHLWLLAIGPVLWGLYLVLSDFRVVYFLLWGLIPVSTELDLAGGLSLDFPVEPVMLLMSAVIILWTLHNLNRLSFSFLYHPVTLILLLHVGWILCTTITSSGTLVSVKFLAAKIWYIIPFYVISYLLLRREKDFKAWFLWIMIPLVCTICIILFRHAGTGFSFEDVNAVLSPFYRNHVDYGLILGVIFPFVVLLGGRFLPRFIHLGLVVLLLLAVYLTYTRAAYVGLVVSAAGLLVIRWKLTRITLATVVVLLGLTIVFLSKDNRYIDYAPDYYRAISHQKFGNLLEATYKLEDISTVERFYRWIAAFYMVQERPLVGFGPNNFVPFYPPYTDAHFLTYVSDNPEQSGVHNYFLMTAVEQGLPGLIIFLALLCIAILRVEWLYHHLRPGFHRNVLSATIGSLFFILFALLLNDMIETDKIGSFFFLNLALIAIVERNARRDGDFLSAKPSGNLIHPGNA